MHHWLREMDDWTSLCASICGALEIPGREGKSCDRGLAAWAAMVDYSHVVALSEGQHCPQLNTRIFTFSNAHKSSARDVIAQH